MKLQSISAVILALLASGCSSVISKVFPLDDLPSPTGPHAVGTQFFEWVDESRDELFTDDPSDQRRLAGQVWYPATATSDAARQPYLDFPARRLDMVAYQSGLPRFMIAHMQRVQTNSVLNATFSSARPENASRSVFSRLERYEEPEHHTGRGVGQPRHHGHQCRPRL